MVTNSPGARRGAAWEDWERYLELKELFQARYGTRFRSMKTTFAAGGNLAGDSITGAGKID